MNVIFETNSYNGNLKKDSESVKLNFFGVDKISSDVTPTFNDILKDLMNRR